MGIHVYGEVQLLGSLDHIRILGILDSGEQLQEAVPQPSGSLAYLEAPAAIGHVPGYADLSARRLHHVRMRRLLKAQ